MPRGAKYRNYVSLIRKALYAGVVDQVSQTLSSFMAVEPLAYGGAARGSRCTPRCRTSSSPTSGSRGSARDLNSSNRRMRTRLSGGVAEVAEQRP